MRELMTTEKKQRPKPGHLRLAHRTVERRAEASRLYLQGKTQVEIATTIGVSQTSVCKYLDEVRRLWVQSAVMDFDSRKATELAKIDAVEATAWEEFVKSQALEYVRTKRVVKGFRKDEDGDEGDGKLEARLTVSSSGRKLTAKEMKAKRELDVKMGHHRRKGEMVAIQEIRERIVRGKGVGDPVFLTIIQGCIDRRCKITGLYAPPDVNVNNNLTLVAWDSLHETRAVGDPVEDRIREAEALAVK